MSPISLDELLSKAPDELLQWIESGRYASDDQQLNWLGLAEGATTKANLADALGEAEKWQQVAASALRRAQWFSELPPFEVNLRELNLSAALTRRFSTTPDASTRAESVVKRFLQSQPFAITELEVLLEAIPESRETMRLLRRLKVLITPLTVVDGLLMNSELGAIATAWLDLRDRLP